MTQATPNYEIQGKDVSMPVHVRDAGSGNAMFMVPSDAAQKLIPGNAFRVVEVAPGQAQILIGIIDYRDNDLGDYDEVAIIFFVYPEDGSPEDAGTFIYKLPVNQSFTCEAGCAIWGFSEDRRKDRTPKHRDTRELPTGNGRRACLDPLHPSRSFGVYFRRGERRPDLHLPSRTAAPNNFCNWRTDPYRTRWRERGTHARHTHDCGPTSRARASQPRRDEHVDRAHVRTV